MKKYPHLALLVAIIMLLTPLTQAFAVINNLTIKESVNEFSYDSSEPTLLPYGLNYVSGDVYSDAPVNQVDLAVYNLSDNQPVYQSTGEVYQTSVNENIYNWSKSIYNANIGPGVYRLKAVARNDKNEVAFRDGYFKIQGVEGLKVVFTDTYGGGVVETAYSSDPNPKVVNLVYDTGVTAYVYAYTDQALTVPFATYYGSGNLLRNNNEDLGTINFINGVAEYPFQAGVDILSGDTLVAKSGKAVVAAQLNVGSGGGGGGNNTYYDQIQGLKMILTDPNQVRGEVSSNVQPTGAIDLIYNSSVTASVYAYTDAELNNLDNTFNGALDLRRINIDQVPNTLGVLNFANGVAEYTFTVADGVIGTGDVLVVNNGQLHVGTGINVSDVGGSGGGTGGGPNSGDPNGGFYNDYRNVTGYVYNWNDSPLNYGNISLYTPGQDRWTGKFGWVNESGQFSVGALDTGTYNVGIEQMGKWNEVGTVTVEAVDSTATVTGFTGSINVNQSGQLEITVPANVRGHLTRGGAPLAKAELSIRKGNFDVGQLGPVSENYVEQYWLRADDQGYFGLNLPEGDYVITDVGFPDTSVASSAYFYKFMILDHPFNVPTDTQNVMEIVVPESNVRGAVYGIPAPSLSGDMTPKDVQIGMGFTEVTLDDQNNEIYGRFFGASAAWKEISGKYVFDLFLPEGMYKVGAFVKGQMVDFPGEYLNVSKQDAAWIVSTDANNEAVKVVDNKVSITVPSANISGTLTKSDGSGISRGWLRIKEKSADEFDWTAYTWAETNDIGEFDLYLEDGDYIVTEVGQPNENPTQLHLEFSVVNGQLNLNGQPAEKLDIALKGPNVVGAVTQANGQPINHRVWVGIRKTASATNPYEWRNEKWVETEPDGSFSLSLQPGFYEVYGISTANEWIEMQNRVFEVVYNGDLKNDGKLVIDGKLAVKLPGKNVRGLLTRGNEPMPFAWVSIRDKNTTNNYGTAASTISKWVQTNDDGKFAIQLEIGDYLVDGISTGKEWIAWQQEFTVASATYPPLNLEVAIPGENLTGQALDENDNPLAHAWVTVAPVSAIDSVTGKVQDHMQSRWFETDDQGNFAAVLPPGNYRVVGISTSTRWVEMSKDFIIPDSGVYNIIVKIPSPNVKGILYDIDGTTALANAWIEIRPEGAIETDYTASKWISTNASGKFSIGLDDNGSSKNYKIVGISYSDQDGYKWVQMKKGFTVTKGQVTNLPIKIPGKNLKGTVYADPGKTQPVANAWIAITPVGTAPGDWSATQWTGADNNGKFGINLSPGNYQVTGVSTEKGWVEFTSAAFTVYSDQSTTFDVMLPASNVQGTVYGVSGNPLTYTWMEIRPAVATDTDYNRFKWIQTNGEGNFELMVAEGDYVVRGLSTADGWVQLNQAFTAPSQAAPVLNLEVRIPAPNLTGTVFGADEGNEVWVAIRPASAPADDWSQTSWVMTKDGKFGFVLQPGTYQFVGVSNAKGWMELTNTVTVPAEGTLDVGIIGAVSINVSGVVTINGDPAAKVTVGIKPEGKKTKWVQTNASGYYELPVADGNYTITYVVTDSDWLPVNTSFTINGASATQNIAVTNP